MKNILVFLIVSLLNSTLTFFEGKKEKDYLVMSFLIFISILLLVVELLKLQYSGIINRLLLLAQTLLMTLSEMSDDYVFKESLVKLIIFYKMQKFENEYIELTTNLMMMSSLIVSQTNFSVIQIIRIVVIIIGVTIGFQLRKQKNGNSQNYRRYSQVNISLPITRVTKGQSSTYHSPFEYWNNENYLLLDEQLNVKRISDKLQILFQGLGIDVDRFLDEIIIQRIDQISKIKLGIKNCPRTLRNILSEIASQKQPQKVLVIQCAPQELNNYFIRIAYNEFDFEITLYESTARDKHLKRQYLYNVMKQLFKTISHEFGTSLNYILAITQSNEELSRIRDQCLVMHSFVMDMVDFNDILGKTFKQQIEQLDIALLLIQVSSLFQYQLKSKGVKFEIENHISQQENYDFTSDSRRIKQILVQLISNAQKFTCSGTIKLIVKPAQQFLQFSVEDTGIGMQQWEISQMEDLFRNDYKSEELLTNSVAGFGLGCYLSNKLAIHLSGLPYNAGGGLQIKENQYRGMTFSFKVKNNLLPFSINFSDTSSGMQQIGKDIYWDVRKSNLLRSVSITKKASRTKKQKNSIIGINRFDSINKNESIYNREVSDQIMEEGQIVKLQTIVSNDMVNDEEKESNFSLRLRKGQHIHNYQKELSFKQYINCDCIKFLIVDDEIINILGLKLILQQMNYDADYSFNGKDALEKLEINQKAHCPYAAIFMDINMPIMDGFQTTKEIHKRFPKRPCIIACTAFNDAATKSQCYECGMQHFLSKPVSVGELFRLLQYLNL